MTNNESSAKVSFSFNEWSLRDELLWATHRWPMIVFCCLAGGLLGWIISLAWRSPNRATCELYVGLNIYRAQEDHNAAQYAGIQFYNADDYKNWQMSNLNSLIYMEQITDATLDQLRGQDSYWSGVSPQELRGMLHAYWRNAGKWRLVVESSDPLRASQAVSIWENVVVEQVHTAIQSAQNIMVLDPQVQAIAIAQTQVVTQTITLNAFRQTLQTRLESVSQKPGDRSLDETDRWLIWLPIAQSNLDPAWKPLLQIFPSQGAPARQYTAWLDQVIQSLDQEISTLENQADALEAQKNKLVVEYASETKRSLGLSANLEVDKINDDPPQITKVRPTSLLILVGSSLGLIGWALTWITRITLKARNGVLCLR